MQEKNIFVEHFFFFPSSFLLRPPKRFKLLDNGPMTIFVHVTCFLEYQVRALNEEFHLGIIKEPP